MTDRNELLKAWRAEIVGAIGYIAPDSQNGKRLAAVLDGIERDLNTRIEDAAPVQPGRVEVDDAMWDRFNEWWDRKDTVQLFYTSHFGDKEMAQAAIAWFAALAAKESP
jgi:hypothetical protein